MFVYYCDKCNKPSTNPLVLWEDTPFILCQRCYAKAVIGYKKPPNEPYLRKPHAYVNGERKVIMSTITRKNNKVNHLQFFINDEKVGYDVLHNSYTANKVKEKFLLTGRMSRVQKVAPPILSKHPKTNDAIRKWTKENATRFNITLVNKRDKELIEALRTAPNKNELLRKMFEAYKKSIT